jgi:hypothetical protein
MSEELNSGRVPVGSSDLVRRLLDALEYVLDKDDSEELQIEITFHGANWETDDEDGDDGLYEYPPTLTDTCPLTILEFSTTDELSGERFEKRDLEELRALLSLNTDSTTEKS